MVSQTQVDRLTRELEDVRSSVFRPLPGMDLRVTALLREARLLREAAAGTPQEPALRSVTNLLTCVERGLASQHPSVRAAG